MQSVTGRIQSLQSWGHFPDAIFGNVVRFTGTASYSVDCYWFSSEHGIDIELDRSENVKTLLCNRAAHLSPVFRVCILACWVTLLVAGLALHRSRRGVF